MSEQYSNTSEQKLNSHQIITAWNEKLSTIDAASDPEWWRNNEELSNVKFAAREALLHDETDDEALAMYAATMFDEAQLRDKTDPNFDIDVLPTLGHMVGEERVIGALKAEATNGVLHQLLLSGLEREATKHRPYYAPSLKLAQQALGLDSMTELLGGNGDFGDAVKQYAQTEPGVRSIRFEDNPYQEGLSWSEQQQTNQEWMADALMLQHDLEKDEALNYAFAWARESDDEKVSHLFEIADTFGAERLRKITKETGIVGIDKYSIPQLERMEQFATNPWELKKTLDDKDVTVVLTNRVGDHNGVMRGIAGDVDDRHERTLFFEVSNFDDIAERMLSLKKADIKPSTAILAAHSAEGRFIVSDYREPGQKRGDVATVMGRRMVDQVVDSGELEDGVTAYAIDGMRGVARLINDCMKPSRGLTDSPQDKSREKIIFQSCHLAAEVDAKDVDDTGNEVVTGKTSVVRSLAQLLASQKINSPIDIYGASSGMQMNPTENGVKFTGQPTGGMGMDRSEMWATKVSVELPEGDEDVWRVDQSEVKDVALRS